jgi:multidrug transporter EmrE-like cation transporter
MKVKVWFFIGMSLLFEIGGDIFVKLSSNSNSKKFILTLLTFASYNVMLLFWLLAVRIDKNITVPGTVWLMAGEVLLVILGVFFFKEAITVKQYIGIFFALIALFLLSY